MKKIFLLLLLLVPAIAFSQHLDELKKQFPNAEISTDDDGDIVMLVDGKYLKGDELLRVYYINPVSKTAFTQLIIFPATKYIDFRRELDTGEDYVKLETNYYLSLSTDVTVSLSIKDELLVVRISKI
jgi:hypothetical protein